MGDVVTIEKMLHDGSRISGPWRLTVWNKHGKPPSYVFSEEHNNTGSCPGEKDISRLSADILRETSNVHVFVEHYMHANEVVNTNKTVEGACSLARDNSILNNMRNCLEVIRIRDLESRDRIHFIDPRVDIVAILPDGKVYEALDMFITRKIEDGDKESALMALYEAFIHPLLSLFPDKLVMTGRMTGSVEKLRGRMTPDQVSFFDSVWKEDVIKRIAGLTKVFRDMQKNSDVSKVDDLYVLYRDMTNKFLDAWLLANVLIAESSMEMSASVIYLGSLHSLNFEKYLERMGYSRNGLFENLDLRSCLKL